MKKIFRQLSFVVLALGLVLLAGGSIGWAKNPKDVVYVIGDSLSDPGNLYALTGFWPPSPPYAQRNCNGPVWPEYFSANLGVPVDSRAYGGALSGVFMYEGMPLSNFINVGYPQYFDYETQYLPGVSEEIDKLLADFPNGLNPDALYVVWAGANDFFLEAYAPGQILPQTIINIVNAVKRLSAAGARHFAVGNIPDIGLTPFAQEYDPEQISEYIALVNAMLEQELRNLPKSYAETMVIFDTYKILRDVRNNPEAFGLTNVTDACLVLSSSTVCADPDKYLFWDDVHPTTAGQAILADQFRSAFCGTGEKTPGLRGRPDGMPPAIWRGVCYGTK